MPVDREARILEPGRAEAEYWRDIVRYRDLLAILAWRDVAVRYKQTVIGIAWAVIRPLLTIVVFTFVFGRLAKLPSEGGAPYALMVGAGMLPWYLFSSALGGAAESIVANASLVGKVYFPRMIIPASALLAALVDFLVSLAMLVLLMAWYRYLPPARIALLPAFVALAVVASLGPGLWLAALNAKYRDFRYALPFILQLGVYISPVGFSSAVVPGQWRLAYSLNPLVGVIDGFRWCILGGELYLPGLALGAAVSVLLLWVGFASFRATERSFADII
jgi:lipopolysaccharide transport system permease protein